MSSFEPRVRFVLAVPTSVALVLALISCDGGGVGDEFASAGSAPIGSGTPGKGGASSGSGASSPGGNGASSGTVTSSGGDGAGGSAPSSGGSSSGAGGSTTPPCTDVQHPDHQDKECSIWAEWDALKGPGEPKDCDAEWLTGGGYCLESCGKCESGGGGSGGTNSGGSGNTGNTGNTGTGGSLGPGPDLPDVNGGQVYWASRYWDCCKPHCAWQGMPSCGSNGVSNDSGDSACGGGSAYACYNQAPRAVGDDVSYGYVAVPNPSCGTCYHLQFTGTGEHNQGDPGSQQISGKHMIVKVINTGGDVGGNQFDLMIPGGGVGINPNTCPQQWGVDGSALGPTAGGFLAACGGDYLQKKECVRDKCNLIPAGDARDGCLWFVDWMQIADNPQFRYEPIDCPSDL